MILLIKIYYLNKIPNIPGNNTIETFVLNKNLKYTNILYFIENLLFLYVLIIKRFSIIFKCFPNMFFLS